MMLNRELLIGIVIGAVALYLAYRFRLIPYSHKGS